MAGFQWFLYGCMLVGSSNKGCSQSISLNMDYEDYDQVSKNYDSSKDILLDYVPNNNHLQADKQLELMPYLEP